MNYVFFGSPIFARLVLEQLVASGLTPAAVVCNPDRPVGRKQIITPPEIKRYILGEKLPIEILQPEEVSLVAHRLSRITPDFFIVAAYGKILKKEILAIPRLGTIGVHSSLLPRHRGTSPIQNAILAGDHETGATIYLMDDEMDHGPILGVHRVGVSDSDTHDTLYPQIWNGGGKLLASLLPDFVEGRLTPRLQDESKATYTKKITSADAFIDPHELEAALGGDAGKATIIDRKIRALNPEPGAWTKIHGRIMNNELRIAEGKDETKGKRAKLLGAKIVDGKLVLTKIQMEGEKPKSI